MAIKLKLPIGLLFLISIGILPLFAQQPQDSSKVPVAVMDFKNNSPVFGYDRLERTIAELLKTELSRSTDILVVERSKMESILREQALAQAGVLATEAAQQVGRLAGAEYIIAGEINTVGNQFRIDAHVIQVTTGRISGEKVTSNSPENVERMIKMLAQNIIFNLTGKGERLQSTKLRNYRSNWAGVGTIALAATTTICHLIYQNKYDRYHRTNFLGDFDRYYNSANRFYKARNLSLVATIAASFATAALWTRDRNENNHIYASIHVVDFPSPAAKLEDRSSGYLVSIAIRF